MSERIWKDTNDQKAVSGILDVAAVKAIYKLSDRKAISSVEGIIAEGKESVIILAMLGEEKRILKAYKINATNFRNMQQYIFGDARFAATKKDRRSIVNAWCKKEFSNLARAKEAGVSVPTPYAFMGNMLVMEHIGRGSIAPALNKVSLDDPKAVFEAIILEVNKLYKGAGLVHADLSQFNILYDEGRVVLIDFGQAVLLDHPKAGEFLERDIYNICKYFSKLGVDADEKNIIAQMREGD